MLVLLLSFCQPRLTCWWRCAVVSAQELVLRKIEEARISGLRAIDISGHQLHEFPEEIQDLKYLVALDASSNFIVNRTCACPPARVRNTTQTCVSMTTSVKLILRAFYVGFSLDCCCTLVNCCVYCASQPLFRTSWRSASCRC